jgi:hypothetical protein
VVKQNGAEVPGAAMRLRSRRRDVVVWIQSAGSAGEYGSVKVTRLGRYQSIRRCIRLGALLTVIGLVRLTRAARPRWRPLLAGGVLTVAGVMLRGGAGGVVLIPGLLFLVYTPFMEAGPDEERKRLSVLRRDLAGYATPAHRRDLEATLDRYPDSTTHEIRDILAGLAATAGDGSVPGARRY